MVKEGTATEQAERNPIDVLAEEFADQCRRGLDPSVEDYVRKYPHLAGEIRELLPTVAMMEQLKARKKTDVMPQRLGDYEILREIGRGGMGVVYEAEHKALGRRVALKVAPRHILHDPVRRERFQREAQAAARLHHTNIVPVFGLGESGGLHYIVMQHISGCGLDEIVASLRDAPPKNDKPRPQIPTRQDPRYWRWVAQLGVQVAEALGHAHDQGTLHRDIKPANILLDSRGTAWVADFGLAKMTGRDDLTQTGDIIGTVQYMAPEALRGKADSRSDLYSLALTLYELVTLQAPFKNGNTLDLLKTIGVEAPERPSKINPAIPADLESIILKGSAALPASRYQTAREFADDLRLFLDDRSPLASSAAAPERLWRWCRRNRALAIAPALVLAAVAGVLLGVSSSHRPANPPQPPPEIASGAADPKNAEESLRLLLQTAALLNAPETADAPFPNDPQRPPQDAPQNRELREFLAALQNAASCFENFAAANSAGSALDLEAAKVYGRLSELQRRSGDMEKAAGTAQRGLKLASRLLAASPENIDCSEIAAQLHGQFGLALQRRESLDAAEENHRKALALYTALVERAPRDDRFRISLAQERFALGEFITRQRRYAEARPLVEESIKVLRAKSDVEPRIRPALFRQYRCLSDILRGLGDDAAADDAMQNAQRYRPPRPPNDRFPNDRPPGDRPPRDFEPFDRRRPE